MATVRQTQRPQPLPRRHRTAGLNARAGRTGKLTPGERRAWRAGFTAGVEHCTAQLELFRIRFCARGVEIDAPINWASASPSPAQAWTPQLKRRSA
jgi:hypothetical protein